jgi:hypothetical protein
VDGGTACLARTLAAIAINGEKSMKFFVTIILLGCLLSPNDSNAQLVKAYGPKVAFTSAHQDFNYTYTDVEVKRRNGFNAALFVEWLNLPFISAVTQLEYVQRGMGMEFVRTGPEGPEVVGRFTRYNRVDYLSIPQLAKIAIPVGMFSPYLSTGPRIDFLLGYKSDDGLFNAVYDEFKKTNIGGTISIGLESVELLPIGLLVEARYNFDFADSYSTQYLKVRNNSFDVWLGVAF